MKKQKPSSPKTILAAAILTPIGAVALGAYAIILALLGFIALAFNDSGAPISTVGTMFIVFEAFAFSTGAQCIYILRHLQRYTTSIKYFIAIIGILIVPIAHIAMYTVSYMYTMWQLSHPTRGYSSTAGDGVYNQIFDILAVMNIAASIYLWYLLLRTKDAPLVKQEITKNYKQADIKLLSFGTYTYRQVGVGLIVAPLMLFALHIFISISVGMQGNNGVIFMPILLLSQLLLTLSPVSIIAGAVLLAKSTQQNTSPKPKRKRT